MTKAEEIADLKKRIALPSLIESAKEKLRQRLSKLEQEDLNTGSNAEEIADLKRSEKKEVVSEGEKPKRTRQKRTPKPKIEPKVKFVKKKGDVKEKEIVVRDIKQKPKKQIAKDKEKPVVTKPTAKKIYKPTTKPKDGEPDCDTLLEQFRQRRAKAKSSQRKSKTTPVFRKISSDVVDAVEKAIKNVPVSKIKESPKEIIRKFGNLQKAANSFLMAFKDVLGKEYSKNQSDIEMKQLESLINKLMKKYSKK